MPSRFPKAPLLFLAATLGSGYAIADEPRYNLISLRAEVSNEVAQDRMHITLYTESQHTDPAKLAAQTTEVLNKALKRARQEKSVTVKTGNRSSYPVYEEKTQKIVSWRERAELQLESGDFAALSQLTGELTQTLKLDGMYFSVSDNVRQQNEDALYKDAVTAFKARAQIVTQALGGKDYKLVNLNLNSNSGGYYPPIMRASAMKASMQDAAPTPEVEAGTRKISLSADGVIEVLLR
ncbi:SIMPL domain-containing protein [Pseudomonas sp. ABC1]|uniref:SIMPL domain-containing protein n=1 Tax=Pseudomonas sp. ABC1 TaxID=2748080 RepID=UPI0015C34B75|nr:SIMPL domain-containing protein [Pseudomonas sp. ABC1]QLF92723.1 SIMPL domain-containing protein [Pseudomonas sp. ABC1]